MDEVRVDTSWGTKMAFLIILAVLLPTVSSIVVPDAFWQELEELERIKSDDNAASNRSLIIANTMERYERNQLLSRSTPCISTFLQNRSISFWYSTSVLPSIFDYVERQFPVEIDLLVRTLQAETATYTVNDVYAIDPNENLTSTVIVLVIENFLDLERMNYSYYYLKMCSFQCKLVVIIARIFEDEENFLREADTLQQSMWSESVGRLVILGSTRETVLLAGSRSYKPDEWCIPSAPILLGSCRTSSVSTVKERTVWQLDTESIDGLDFSMNGCSLIVAYHDSPPYAYVTNETADDKISGLEGYIIEEILYSMNARISRERINLTLSDDENNDNFRMIIDQIKNVDSQVDLLVGGFLWNPHEETDYTMAYDMVPLVWMTPVKANVSLRGLITPFSTFVWIAILCVILLGILVKLFLIKDISFLNMLALIIGVSVFRRPTIPSSRILFLCWTLFGFFMSQYYLASLADQLVNTSNLQIETMKELLSSGLELGGTSQYADLFEEIDEKDDDDEEDFIIRSIREKFLVFSYDDYILHLLDLLNGKDQTMALVVKLNVSNSGLNLPQQYVHALRESMGSHPLAIATWKGFPCLRKINIKMQQLIETGIMGYYARLYTLNGTYYRLKDKTNSDSDVNLKSVVPIFLILIIGYLAGFCVFIIEIIAYPSKWLA